MKKRLPGRTGSKVVESSELVQSSCSHSSGERKLLENDIPRLLKSLRMFSTKWFSIGIMLQIPKHVLSKIEADYRGDTDRQLIEMIDTWIGTGANCYMGTLIEALGTLGYKRDILQNARKEAEVVQLERAQVNVEKVKVMKDILNILQKSFNEDVSLADVTEYVKKTSCFSESQLNEVLERVNSFLDTLDKYLQEVKVHKEEIEHVESYASGLKHLLEEYHDGLEADKKKSVDNQEEKLKIIIKINDVKSDLEHCVKTLQLISEHEDPTIDDGISYCKQEIQQAVSDLVNIQQLLEAIKSGQSSKEKLPEQASLLVGGTMGAVVGAVVGESLGAVTGTFVGIGIAWIGYILGVAKAIKLCMLGAVFLGLMSLFGIRKLHAGDFSPVYSVQDYIAIFLEVIELLELLLIGVITGLAAIHIVMLPLSKLYILWKGSSNQLAVVTAKTITLLTTATSIQRQ